MTLNPDQFSMSRGGLWQGAEHEGETYLSGEAIKPTGARTGIELTVHQNPDTIAYDKPYRWSASTSGAAGGPLYMQRGETSTPTRAMIAAESAAKRRVEGRDPQTGRRIGR